MNTRRYLLCAQGPGETGQARALADFLYRQGGKVTIALQQEVNCSFLANDEDHFEIIITPEPKDLAHVLLEKRHDALLLFNSKIWHKDEEWRQQGPTTRPLTVCIDSNWLFNTQLYPAFPFLTWADHYLINIPSNIFNAGLENNGGAFTIEQSMLSKMRPIGLIPAYQPINAVTREQTRKLLNIAPHEQLIFAYVSGLGADFRGWALDNLIHSIKELLQKGMSLKMLYVGPDNDYTKSLDSIPWIIKRNKLGAAEFYETLAASDLVFQHQGLGTLAQTISARVPVIANVSIPAHPSLPLLHRWEVAPFAHSGVCKLLDQTTSLQEAALCIEQMLTEEKEKEGMKKAQERCWENGEAACYNFLESLLA